MHSMSSWIIIGSWCIVVRTLCSWNVLLYSRIYVHIMLGRDVRWYNWVISVHSVSEGIIIISWCIVLHALCERVKLICSRIYMQIMLGRDIRWYYWIV